MLAADLIKVKCVYICMCREGRKGRKNERKVTLRIRVSLWYKSMCLKMLFIDMFWISYLWIYCKYMVLGEIQKSSQLKKLIVMSILKGQIFRKRNVHLDFIHPHNRKITFSFKSISLCEQWNYEPKSIRF